MTVIYRKTHNPDPAQPQVWALTWPGAENKLPTSGSAHRCPMHAQTRFFTMLTVGALALLLQGCGGDEAPTATTAEPAATTPTAVADSGTTSTAAAATTSMYSDLEGKPINIADYAGKKVFVNYWATWCAPCIKEIPSIARAAEAMGEDYVF